ELVPPRGSRRPPWPRIRKPVSHRQGPGEAESWTGAGVKQARAIHEADDHRRRARRPERGRRWEQSFGQLIEAYVPCHKRSRHRRIQHVARSGCETNDVTKERGRAAPVVRVSRSASYHYTSRRRHTIGCPTV